MSTLKCKMCGGSLEITEDKSVAVCEYCGTKQTVPVVDDEKKVRLYERANRLRFNNEFDKAEGVYASIIEDFPAEAEAYWGLLLCKYGIEYVDDPATGKKVPTCHRSSFDSFMDENDFDMVMEYADTLSRGVYREEAKQIEEIRKGIIEVSGKEEPYDIFICYKEADENGERTLDSVMAQDIYDALTDKGYRVFFSRVSLEDKLGTEYEPYIFAALNSAKIMLAFGTNYDYYNAVWVKNEWSRYLKLMAKDKTKHLIPCYKNIDAYDMPKEFAKLQAQDLGKVGAEQDLLRGIDKILWKKKEEPAATVIQTVVSENPNIEPLLKRAFMFLEDGKWEDADTYCEKVLDKDPENAEAYLGKLMVELQVKNRKQLADCAELFDDRDNYGKMLRFGDEKLKAEMRGYITQINERNENSRLTGIYDGAVKSMQKANDEKAYQSVAEIFQTIPGFKDAEELAKQCFEKAEECHIAAKKRKKAFAIGTPIVFACIAFVIALTTVIIPTANRNKAYIIYGDVLNAANVGDTISFGKYEQDNNTSNGKEEIEWIVLSKKNGKMLVISKYALDCQQYNTSYTDTTWENCSLRKWLNGTFISKAFNSPEKEIIAEEIVHANKNPRYNTNPGNDTSDKVFLLGIGEKYISGQCKATKYAVANGAYENGGNGNCWWWLRTPGDHQNRVAVVSNDGSVYYNGHTVHIDICAVRPAMWIDISEL